MSEPKSICAKCKYATANLLFAYLEDSFLCGHPLHKITQKTNPVTGRAQPAECKPLCKYINGDGCCRQFEKKKGWFK